MNIVEIIAKVTTLNSEDYSEDFIHKTIISNKSVKQLTQKDYVDYPSDKLYNFIYENFDEFNNIPKENIRILIRNTKDYKTF